MIEDALRQAGHKLSERERFIFLMKYDDTLSSKQIALRLGVQPPRVTQLLQQIGQRIKQEVIRVLSQKYNLGTEALEECLTDLTENPEHSIIKSLKAP
jgi:DNA-directed RNA polymerase specialized sigma24 family protein